MTPGTPSHDGKVLPKKRIHKDRGWVRLKRNSRGQEVVRLQRLLNARLKMRAPLQIDGVFGPRTLAAVRAFQRLRGIAVDGIVGRVTWVHLIGTDTIVLPEYVKGLEVIKAPPPPGPPEKPPAEVVVTVWEWPLSKKLLAVVERLPSRLPGKAAAELRALMSPVPLATALVLVALFLALSGGTAAVIGAIAFGFDVALSFASALQIAMMAHCSKDLDEAADELAHVIIAIGVAVFVANVAKIATRARARVGNQPPPAAPPAELPPPPVPPPPVPAIPANPTLARLRRLSRPELAKEVQRATGDKTIVQWESVGYGDLYTPVRAGPVSAERLGVRPGDIIGYKILEGHQMGRSAVGDLMHVEPQNISPYGDPFVGP